MEGGKEGIGGGREGRKEERSERERKREKRKSKGGREREGENRERESLSHYESLTVISMSQCSQKNDRVLYQLQVQH